MRKNLVFQALCLSFLLILAGCGIITEESSATNNATSNHAVQNASPIIPTTNDDASNNTNQDWISIMSNEMQAAYNQETEQYVSLWHGDVANAYESGYGTREDPYIIKEANQLAYLAQQVNDGKTFEGQYFELVSDIILNAPETLPECDFTEDSANSCANEVMINQTLNKWIPIGTREHPFNGQFNGRGHKIEGMVIDAIWAFEPYSASVSNRMFYQYVGLFGGIENARILNVKLENACVIVPYDAFSSTNNYMYHLYAGSLVGHAKASNGGSVEICWCSAHLGEVIANPCDGITTLWIGGLIGSIDASQNGYVQVMNCLSANNIFYLGDSSVNIGGIVGVAYRNTLISNCVSRSLIMAKSTTGAYTSAYIGGFCGSANDTDIYGSISDAIIVDNLGGEPELAAAFVTLLTDASSIDNCFYTYDSVHKTVRFTRDDSTVTNTQAIPFEYLSDPEWAGQHLDLYATWTYDEYGELDLK